MLIWICYNSKKNQQQKKNAKKNEENIYSIRILNIHYRAVKTHFENHLNAGYYLMLSTSDIFSS